MEKNIVIIDNNFAIRETLKILLKSNAQNKGAGFNLYSSQNGIEGLGFVYITQPEIVIVDTTLPKYSGNELLYFLLTNKKFHTEKIKVFVLTEKKQTIRVPSNFIVLNKADKNFNKRFLEEVSGVPGIVNSDGLKYSRWSKSIVNYGNRLDILKTRLTKESLLSKILLLPIIFICEVLLSFLLIINYIVNGRVPDSNIKQEKRNLSLLRSRHYPTAIAGSVGIILGVIVLISFFFSQNLFLKEVSEDSQAFGFGEISWFSTLDSSTDVTNPVTGSAGEVLNGVDFVTQLVEFEEDESYEIKSARFDADTEVIRITDPVQDQDYNLEKGTIEFMYSPLEAHTTNKEMTFFSIFSDTDNKIEFKKLDDANDSLSLLYKCEYCDDAEVLVSGADYAFATDEWIKFTVHWNAYAPINQQLIIKIDDADVLQDRNTASINPVSLTSPTAIFIGNSSASGTNEANGRIDDFTIYLGIAQPEATPVGTPAPTPVFSQNSGQASWYSTFDSIAVVTTPQIGDVPGIFSGASFIDGPAQYNSALYFDGAGKSLYIEGVPGNHYSLNEGAVEFYYRPIYEADHDAEINLFSIRKDDDEEIRLYKKNNAGSNALAFAFSCQTLCGGEETIAYAEYDPYWNPGDWIFIRVAWNDNSTLDLEDQLEIFIDGDQLTHTDQAHKILGDNIVSSPDPPIVYVGNRTEDGADSALGSIDEFKMYTTTVIPTATVTPTPSITPTPTITPTPSVVPTSTPTPRWYSTLDSLSAITSPVNGSAGAVTGKITYIDGSPHAPGTPNNGVNFLWNDPSSRIVANVTAGEIDESKGRVTFHLRPNRASIEASPMIYFQLKNNFDNKLIFRRQATGNFLLSYDAKASGASNFNSLTVSNSDLSWTAGEWLYFEIYYDISLDQDNELRLFMSRGGEPLAELPHTHTGANTVTTPISSVTKLIIGADDGGLNPIIRGVVDDFRYYDYHVAMPTATVPLVSPTPTPIPDLSILWYSTLANPTAAWQPVIGTTPTTVFNVTFATDGTPEARSAAVFNAAQSNVQVQVRGTDYDKVQGKAEFWYKPEVPYTQNNNMFFFRLRALSFDKIALSKFNTAQNHRLEIEYDASCILTGDICDNSGSGISDNRRTRIAATEYSDYWVVGKWMKFSVVWDANQAAEADKLKLFITHHDGNGWVTVEPAKTHLGVMNPNNFEIARILIIGSGNFHPNAQLIARGNISDFQLWGLGPGISSTPTPTPIPLTAAEPIWYSTMEDAAALTTPVVGKGATSHNVTFEAGLNGNGAKIDASSEHVTVGSIPYSTPPVSFKKDKGAIEFYYKPDSGATAAQTITLFNVRVDANNQLKMYKQTGSNPLHLEYTHGGSTKSVSISNANFSPYWQQGVWMKVRAEWDKTKTSPDDLKLFLDNNRPTSNKTGGVFSDMTGDPSLYIGNVTNSGSEQAMGVIDDFNIFGDPDTRRFEVDSTGDQADANVGDTVCATSTGSCTLRAAMQEANNSAAPDKIIFNIPGGGPHTINVSSALPTITTVLEIDGTTQQDVNCSTKELRIVLNGNNINAPGISFNSTTSGTVKGLVIHRFTKGINYTSSTGGTVQCNIIGLGQDGVTAIGNTQAGINLESSSSSNTIGGNNAGEGNIISGNYKGISVSSSNSNVIQGNYIGTNKDGEYARGNTLTGIEMNNSNSTIVGDSGASAIPASCTGACNIISGNGSSGINYVTGASASENNTIKANYIGVDKTGAFQVANYDGIKVTKVSNLNISYNMLTSVNTGVYALSSSTGAISTITVDNNYIGINRASNAVLMESTYGVVLFASSGSTFSTPTVSNNTIGGSVRGAGIYVYGPPVTSLSIKTNHIGTNVSNADFANKYGIQFVSPTASNNVIGGSDPSDGNTIARNKNYGIYLSGTKNLLLRYNTIRNNSNDGVSIVGNNSAENNTVIQNNIYENAGLGINLRTSTSDVVSYNDPGDTDSTSEGDGPNNLQNYPVLIKAEYEGTTLTLYGAFQSESGKYYRLDFYSGESADGSGFGEGENHFHTITGINGNSVYNFSQTPLVITDLTLPAEHKYISATATECGQEACSTLLSTSEFGLTGFRGNIIGKRLSLDNNTGTLPRFYVAADGRENIPDLFAFDILPDNSLSLQAGYNSNNMSPLGIVGLDNNNFAAAGYANTNQYQVYNIIDGYQCSYNIGTNAKSMDIKIAKNSVGSKYVYLLTNSEAEELTLIQGKTSGGSLTKYGEYLSEVKDMGTPVKYYHSIVWDETKNGGEIKIQVRSGNTSDLTNEEWYGPDGTRGTFFVLSGENQGYVLPKAIQGKQYIQYRLLIESDQVVSPALNSITIRYGS